LGKKGFLYNDGDHIYESTVFSFKKSGSIAFKVDIQNGVVRNIKSTFDGLWHAEITPKDWSAYNMSTILKSYGTPTSVETYLDLPYDQVLYSIRLIYKDIDTIILFSGEADPSQKPSDGRYKVCPDMEISTVSLWLGKNPINNEPQGEPLLTSASLSSDEFMKLFEKTPESACLTLRSSQNP
jgi:hypothetical protein